MESETIDNSVIDPNLDSYKSFFDHGWCEDIFNRVENSPLKAAVDTLMLAWRSTDGAHRLPWLMIEQLRAYSEGEVNGRLGFPDTYGDRVIQGLCDKLEAWTPSLGAEQRREQRRAVARIEREASQAHKTALSQIHFDAAGYWKGIVRTSEFCFSVLGAQRTNYASLFFAYEDFLASAIRAAKEPGYSSKKEKIGVALARLFGPVLAHDCWNDAEIDLAQLVRHAVAHNSGRHGTALEKHKARFVDATGMNEPVLKGNQFNIVNGTIQITPCNTTYLFGVLKDRVTKFVEKAG